MAKWKFRKCRRTDCFSQQWRWSTILWPLCERVPKLSRRTWLFWSCNSWFLQRSAIHVSVINIRLRSSCKSFIWANWFRWAHTLLFYLMMIIMCTIILCHYFLLILSTLIKLSQFKSASRLKPTHIWELTHSHSIGIGDSLILFTLLYIRKIRDTISTISKLFLHFNFNILQFNLITLSQFLTQILILFLQFLQLITNLYLIISHIYFLFLL